MRPISRRQFNAFLAQATTLGIVLPEILIAQDEGGGDEGGGDEGGGDEGSGEDGGGDEGNGSGANEGSEGSQGNEIGSGDVIDEATGDRTLASSDVDAATSDPTIDLSGTDWGGLFDTNTSANSCLANDPNGISGDAKESTESEPDQSGFWEASWFNFELDIQIGVPGGLLTTDPEIGSLTGNVPIPIGPEGGFYFTGDNQGTFGVGGYIGLPSEGAGLFGQIGETNGVPGIDFGIEVGPAQLSVGVDVGPMIEAGGRALESVERGLYEYYSTPMFGE